MITGLPLFHKCCFFIDLSLGSILIGAYSILIGIFTGFCCDIKVHGKDPRTLCVLGLYRSRYCLVNSTKAASIHVMAQIEYTRYATAALLVIAGIILLLGFCFDKKHFLRVYVYLTLVILITDFVVTVVNFFVAKSMFKRRNCHFQAICVACLGFVKPHILFYFICTVNSCERMWLPCLKPFKQVSRV